MVAEVVGQEAIITLRKQVPVQQTPEVVVVEQVAEVLVTDGVAMAVLVS
jgi:hypothetical protein